MRSSNRIKGILRAALHHVVMFSLCFMMASCKESSKDATGKELVASSAQISQPIVKDIQPKSQSSVNVELQDSNVTDQQLQNNPPTASRPRFPIPKSAPMPTPAPVQGNEEGVQ